MKALIILSICVGTFCFSDLVTAIFPHHETLNQIMGDGINEHLENRKNTRCEYFSVPVNNSSDILFREDGKVYVGLNKDDQTFDITELQQLHRLEDLKNFIQQIK